ncbi:MAG: hypothetical protein ACRYFS_13115 [Janthinobacterium lividum]
MQIDHWKQEELEAQLKAGEKLLWSGQPDPMRALWVSQGAIYVFLFGLIWTPMTIFAAVVFRPPPGGSPGFPLFESIAMELYIFPFILLGFACLWAPRSAYVQSERTTYGITDQRIIILKGAKKRFMNSYHREALGVIKCIERSDGSGELIFAQDHYIDSEDREATTNIQFIGVPKVRSVETILRAALTAV